MTWTCSLHACGFPWKQRILTMPRFLDQILSSWEWCDAELPRLERRARNCYRTLHMQRMIRTVDVKRISPSAMSECDVAYQFINLTGDLESFQWLRCQCFEALFYGCLHTSRSQGSILKVLQASQIHDTQAFREATRYKIGDPFSG